MIYLCRDHQNCEEFGIKYNSIEFLGHCEHLEHSDQEKTLVRACFVRNDENEND
jgi:hypothetical protein